MEFIMIAFVLSIIARSIIFYRRDIKWWKSLIPGYNKYILGKLSETKKLGIINAIIQPLVVVYFAICTIIEIWIVNTYGQLAITPEGEMTFAIVAEVPKNIANVAIWSKYLLIILAIFAIIVWTIMMRKFTKLHNKSSWFMILWALCPVIPYWYFVVSNNIYLDGKLYTMKRMCADG